MTRAELEVKLAEADAEGWKYVGNEAPPLGARVEVFAIDVSTPLIADLCGPMGRGRA